MSRQMGYSLKFNDKSIQITFYEGGKGNERKEKMTINDFKNLKEGRKFSFVTAYDYTMASIINDSDVEIILVEDSLGMIMLGLRAPSP